MAKSAHFFRFWTSSPGPAIFLERKAFKQNQSRRLNSALNLSGAMDRRR
jgi:hypothetical protein